MIQLQCSLGVGGKKYTGTTRNVRGGGDQGSEPRVTSQESRHQAWMQAGAGE